MDLRDDVLKDRSIRLEQTEAPDGVVAVGCGPPFSLTPAVIITTDEPVKSE